MKIILSLNRLLNQLRTYHDLGPIPDEEVAVRLDKYSAGYFNDIRADYGVSMGPLIKNSGATGEFNLDISGTKAGATVDWQKLIAGLEMLNPVAISVERQDLATICDGLVYSSLCHVWHQIAPHLERITVQELRPTIEEICMKVVWAPPAELTPYEFQDQVRDLQADALLEEAGIRNPLEKIREQEEFNRQEIEAEQARRQSANSDWMARFGYGN